MGLFEAKKLYDECEGNMSRILELIRSRADEVSEACDHIVEVIESSAGPGLPVRAVTIKQSDFEHTQQWRDFNKRIFQCIFCPKCGKRLRPDEQ